MTSRTLAKPGRSTGKTTGKSSGKDQGKGDKQTASILEIVPGKFNENDWLSLLDNDETEDYIADLFESIWKETSKQIEQLYIRRQLLPFTLMMTENALSSVIQWAFLERDEPKPVDGDFWTEDAEPMSCTMDNWGEGVVPGYREEPLISSMEVTPIFVPDHASSIPTHIPALECTDLTSDSLANADPRTPRSRLDQQSIDRHQDSDITPSENGQDHLTSTDRDSHRPGSTSKGSSRRLSLDHKPSNHNILVIETQPPKLEPFSELFYQPAMGATGSTLPNQSSAALLAKRRRVNMRKVLPELDRAASPNVIETVVKKSSKKNDPKLFDDQHVEDVISKAPVAAHSMLKSIMSRPPGYRELELDEYGNVIAIAKLDPDKLGPKSVRVKCDVVKVRKPVIEARLAPKQAQQIKSVRTESDSSPIKLVFPEQSTDVGDLIQPVPGVLYEDAKLKKGDPRRYQTGLSKYTNFHDETRPLKPIGRPGDLTMIQIAHDLLRKSKDPYDDDDDDDDDTDRQARIPKLHRLSRMPPIASGSNASSA